MLGFVLQDHVVDKAVSEERVVPVEVGIGEGLDDHATYGVQVGVGVGPVEQVEGRTLLPGMERGIVNVVKLAV